MKKMIHIAAAPVLTALLAACAAPVEQGRLDQIEEATTKLADQTLMEGLRDDFEEVEKRWEEAKQKGLVVAGLQDDFEEVEKQLNELNEVGKETGLAAKLALADELKKNLEDLASDLDKISSPKEPPSVSVYREIRFNFRNLDAVESSKEGRERYVERLTEYFDSLDYGPPKKWEVTRRDVAGNPADYTFTVSDLADGIEGSSDITKRPGLKEMQSKIAEITRSVKWKGITGIPVVTREPERKLVKFQRAEVDYSSVSGTGKHALTGGPDSPCTWSYTFNVGTEAKQVDAQGYLWGVDGEKKPKRVTSTFKIPVEAAYDDQHRCGPTHKETLYWYLMVVRKEAEKPLVVAEYHTLSADTEGNRSVHPEPGRLTEDGYPACPPTGTGWKTAREEFKNILGPCDPDDT